MPEFDLRRLEELGLNSSAPPGQLLYDGWLLRLLPGQAKRARSINAIYPSYRALAEKLAYCEQLYRSHDLPAIFRITPFSEPSTLDAELERLGYLKFDTTSVETAPIKQPADPQCLAQALPLPEWVEVVGDLRDSPRLHRASHLARVLSSPLQHQAMVLRQDGAIVAAGLTIVEDAWAGVFDIVTDSAARRRGHGRQMLHDLLIAASNLGARQAYLQVLAGNTAARSLYAEFGFQQRYRYWYRRQPESKA